MVAIGVDDLRRTMWPVRLESRHGIGIRLLIVIQQKTVPITGSSGGRGASEVSTRLGRQFDFFARNFEEYLYALSLRSPDAKVS